jgi:hypothetical protein
MSPTSTPTLPDQALESIATDMIATLAVPGCAYVHRTLRGRAGPLPWGRQIVYQRTVTGYRLAIGDPDRRPTADEAGALAAAFGVPSETAWRAGEKKGRAGKLLFLECEWRAV